MYSGTISNATSKAKFLKKNTFLHPPFGFAFASIVVIANGCFGWDRCGLRVG